MEFLIVTLGVILFDRATPAGEVRFTASALRPDVKVGWREYGWLRFPPPLFAAGVCICAGLIDFFPEAREGIGIVAVVYRPALPQPPAPTLGVPSC